MKELRIALVLYGGVSLAIYMNGISTELWNLLRASRARVDGTRDELDDTANLYAELLDELQCLTGDDLRVVVDVIAGTSAGGVNGAVLAKAIVEGGDASTLTDVWLKEADISKLLAEPAARSSWGVRAALWALTCVSRRLRSLKSDVSGVPGISWEWMRDHLYSMLFKPDGRSTLLDGDYFTRMIATTFARMGSGDVLLPDRASLDLYLTRTDLHGWPRHLPVSQAFHDAPLYERTHAHAMHFRRKPNGADLHDDFGLTYATRSTAGFPIAFSPIDYGSIREAYTDARPSEPVPDISEFHLEHLPEHRLFGFPADGAWMVDGGVLDNKPFSHVTRTIERKPAEHEVYRVIAYVEPDPETTLKPPSDRTIPRPLQVAGNLWKLFRHEPIHEDLRLLRDRNARVADIKSFIDANAESARRSAQAAGRMARLTYPPISAEADLWKKATNAYAAQASLSGYPGYVLLKAPTATSVLADVTCRALGYPYASRHAYFIRQLVSVWINRRGALAYPKHQKDKGHVLNEAQRSLLSAFDVPFRLRRLRALARATNELYDPTRYFDRVLPVNRAVLDYFKSNIEDIALEFEVLQEDDEEVRGIVIESLGSAAFLSTVDDVIAANTFDFDPVIETHDARIHALYATLSRHFRDVSDRQDAKLSGALLGLGGDLDAGDFQHIMEAFVTFPFVDLTAFPLMVMAGIEDLIEVEVMRVSPLDTARKGDPSLKSLGLMAFQGFLDRDARDHDMRFGRIDGADRVIALLLAASGTDRRDPQCADELRNLYLGKLRQAVEGGPRT